jgi:hypothetical protein
MRRPPENRYRIRSVVGAPFRLSRPGRRFTLYPSTPNLTARLNPKCKPQIHPPNLKARLICADPRGEGIESDRWLQRPPGIVCWGLSPLPQTPHLRTRLTPKSKLQISRIKPKAVPDMHRPPESTYRIRSVGGALFRLSRLAMLGNATETPLARSAL